MMPCPPVTLGIHAHNQESYIKEAVLGALAQDYSPLEIIISDDASTDATWDIIQEAVKGYQGPHEIILNRNPQNLYIGGHLSKLNQMASGEIYVQAAGDDISHPSRVSELVKAFNADKDVYFAVSDWMLMDQQGRVIRKVSFVEYVRSITDSYKDFEPSGLTPQKYVKYRYPFVGAAAAWRKELFCVFGPLPPGLASEDIALPFRTLLLEKKIVYIEQPLVYWRSAGFTSICQDPTSPGRDPYHNQKFQQAQSFLMLNTFLHDANLVKKDAGVIKIIHNTMNREKYAAALFDHTDFLGKVKVLVGNLFSGIGLRFLVDQFIISAYFGLPPYMRSFLKSFRRTVKKFRRDKIS